MSQHVSHASSTSNSPLHTSRIQRAKWEGRTFERTQERQLSCLESIWEAIKIFFAWLCCCSAAVEPDFESSEVLPPSSASVRRRLPNPAASQRTPITGTPPQTAPTPPHSPVPSGEGPITPPVTAGDEPIMPLPPLVPARDEPIAPRVFLRGEPLIPFYPPLEHLMQKRKEEISYIPTLPSMEPMPLPKPEGFPLIEAVKEVLGTPQVRGQPKAATEFFITKMKGIYLSLLKEHVEVTVEYQPKSFKGEIVHPDQIELAKAFVRDQLMLFNGALKDFPSAVPIDCDAFFTEFHELETIAPVWKVLWELAQKPYLEEEDLTVLHAISSQLPESSSSFHEQYPVIEQRLKDLSTTIGNKMILSLKNREQVSEIQRAFIEKLKIVFNPLIPQDCLDRHLQTFLANLTRDLLQLFQCEEDEALTVEHKFDISHIKQMRAYLMQEAKHFNAEMQKFTAEHPLLGVPFTAVDPYDYVQQVFTGIQPLIDSWKMMEQMLKAEKDIDEKIELLTQIANTLPEADAEVWTRFPKIKDGMGVTLIPLSLSYFSDYRLDMVATRMNRGKYEADQMRRCRIESAFELMALKLGCKDFKPPEIHMDTAEDADLGNAENEAIYVLHAREITKIYDDWAGTSGQRFASMQAAARLDILLSQVGRQQQATLCANIVQKLRQNIRDPVVAHLKSL